MFSTPLNLFRDLHPNYYLIQAIQAASQKYIWKLASIPCNAWSQAANIFVKVFLSLDEVGWLLPKRK